MKNYQKDLLFLIGIICVYFIPIALVGADRIEDYLSTQSDFENNCRKFLFTIYILL
jgi:hypothetical protein